MWVIINVLFLVLSFLYIWFVQPHPSLLIKAGQLFAQLALILFIINVNMYFIFLVIRKVKKRKLTIFLAKFSRKLMKTHIPTALIGTALILIHAVIMFTQLGEILAYFHLKMVSGYLSLVLLCFTLVAGYLRHKKSSGARRKFHQITAFIFTLIFVLHLFSG